MAPAKQQQQMLNFQNPADFDQYQAQGFLQRRDGKSDGIGAALYGDRAVATLPLDHVFVASLINTDTYLSRYAEVVNRFLGNSDLLTAIEKFIPIRGFQLKVKKTTSMKMSNYLLRAGNKSTNNTREAFRKGLFQLIRVQIFKTLYDSLDGEEFLDEMADFVAEKICDKLAPANGDEAVPVGKSAKREWFLISESHINDALLEHIGCVVTLSGIIAIDRDSSGWLKGGQMTVYMDLKSRTYIYNKSVMNEKSLGQLSLYIKKFVKMSQNPFDVQKELNVHMGEEFMEGINLLSNRLVHEIRMGRPPALGGPQNMPQNYAAPIGGR